MGETFRKPLTIGVAGGTGSGKSTVSAALLQRIGATHIAYIPHDTYYLALSEMPRTSAGHANFDHPNSLDTPRMIRNIRDLQAGKPTEIPIYDFRTHSRLTETRRIEPQPIILVEGILIFAEPEVCKLFDIRIFVDTDADIRLIRRLRRDITERGRTVDSVIEQYLDSVRPMHLEFVEPSRRYADVIIPEGGFNTVAIDMIADRIRHLVEVTSS
ncbi:MAG TPA: uridine kinase [Aggregatilineales bacterium]|nr:uridine kinase [Aggregatilineales bacterium]